MVRHESRADFVKLGCAANAEVHIKLVDYKRTHIGRIEGN